jgi:hypothetical protein
MYEAFAAPLACIDHARADAPAIDRRRLPRTAGEPANRARVSEISRCTAAARAGQKRQQSEFICWVVIRRSIHRCSAPPTL